MGDFKYNYILDTFFLSETILMGSLDGSEQEPIVVPPSSCVTDVRIKFTVIIKFL